MSTYSAKKKDITPKWYVVDLNNKVLGRAATEIARVLRGKNKPTYTPHADTGDFVIVINAEKVKLTGNKWDQKTYYSHSGYVGGIKEITAGELLIKKPGQILKTAVAGMLPKNILGRNLLKKLKIYKGDAHPHSAQQPQNLTL